MTRKLIVNLWRGENLPDFSEDAYGPIDVLRLWRGARRHITDLELHVLCDEHYLCQLVDMTGCDGAELSGEEFVDIQASVRVHKYAGHGVGGWTNVMESFRPGLFGRDVCDEYQRVLLVGLDTVFCGNCDWLFDWTQAPIGLPVDPYDSSKPCDAVITFDPLGANIAWDEYKRAAKIKPFPHLLSGKPSEMVLLQHLSRQHGWPYLEQGMKKLKSLKGCNGREWAAIPDGTSIVYLHGRPKLPDLPKEHPVRREWERVE